MVCAETWREPWDMCSRVNVLNWVWRKGDLTESSTTFDHIKEVFGNLVKTRILQAAKSHNFLVYMMPLYYCD